MTGGGDGKEGLVKEWKLVASASYLTVSGYGERENIVLDKEK